MLGQKTKAELIIKALNQCADYKLKTIPKKNGSLRKLYVPPTDLKKLQRLLLRNFFYLFKSKISLTMHGFLPGRSIVSNANSHKDKSWKHVTRLDLKDAFPSVKAENIRSIFQEYLFQEIADYADQYRERKLKPRKWFKKIYHLHPIFPSRRVRWFRRLIINNLDSDFPWDITARFIEHLVTLTTYQGALPQGAPTSPFLLNLVLSHLKIPENISRQLNEEAYDHALSIYADDIVISTKKEITRDMLGKLISTIEASGTFTVNREKTIQSKRRQIDPLITGLRVAKRFNSRGGRINNKVIVPKKKILAIRSLIHQATIDPSADKDNRVAGYIAFLKGVYPKPEGYPKGRIIGDIPPAVLKPYLKYLKSLDSRPTS